VADAAPVGAGSAPRPIPQAPDGDLRIRGGIGGISFQLEELLRGVAVLDGLVQQLTGIEEEALRIQEALEPYLYDAHATGSAALDAVAAGRQHVGRVRRELVEVSAGVRASARDYEAAEERQARPHLVAIDELSWSRSPWLLGRDLMEQLVNGLLPGGQTAGEAVRETVDAGHFPLLQPRPVSVEPLGEESLSVEPSMAWALRRTQEIHARGDGEIEVVRTDNGGAPSWLVLIPGTQLEGENMGGSNPLDEAGIAEAMGYDSRYVVPAIAEALREAGASRGDQVVAVGHSQGGVHAMNLSHNKAFLGEFDLKYVLTAGSPTGGITPGPGTTVLHLEHAQDWVPGSDGKANPETRDRTTVTLAKVVEVPEGEDPGLGPGHALDTYAEGAELAAASQDPSLKASTAVFAGAVGSGATAAVSRFKLVRASAPASAPSPDPRAALRIPQLPETRSGAGPR
jgi:hypothetical protein